MKRKLRIKKWEMIFGLAQIVDGLIILFSLGYARSHFGLIAVANLSKIKYNLGLFTFPKEDQINERFK